MARTVDAYRAYLYLFEFQNCLNHYKQTYLIINQSIDKVDSICSYSLLKDVPFKDLSVHIFLRLRNFNVRISENLSICMLQFFVSEVLISTTSILQTYLQRREICICSFVINSIDHLMVAFRADKLEK